MLLIITSTDNELLTLGVRYLRNPDPGINQNALSCWALLHIKSCGDKLYLFDRSASNRELQLTTLNLRLPQLFIYSNARRLNVHSDLFLGAVTRYLCIPKIPDTYITNVNIDDLEW